MTEILAAPRVLFKHNKDARNRVRNLREYDPTLIHNNDEDFSLGAYGRSMHDGCPNSLKNICIVYDGLNIDHKYYTFLFIDSSVHDDNLILAGSKHSPQSKPVANKMKLSKKAQGKLSSNKQRVRNYNLKDTSPLSK